MDQLRRFFASAPGWVGRHLLFACRAIWHSMFSTWQQCLVWGLIVLAMVLPLLLYNAPRNMGLLEAWAGPKGTDIGCLTLSIYRERATLEKQEFDEAAEGLMAIGWVMKTRYQLGFHQKGNPIPQNVCDVVWEPEQFSWTLWNDAMKFTVGDLPDFYRAYAAAQDVLGETEAGLAVRYFLGTADHYFNKEVVLPDWAAKFRQELWIGKHLFLTDTSRYPARRAELEAQYGVRKR